MKTTSEMISVMQAFERGEKIEASFKGDPWGLCVAASIWDWRHCDYRIAAKPKRKVKLQAWINADGYLVHLSDEYRLVRPAKRIPALDQEIEVSDE